MKQNLLKSLSVLVLIIAFSAKAVAQLIPTLEMRRADLPATSGFGTSLTPMTSVLWNDVANSNNFAGNSPEINVTISLQNQQFTGLNYGGVLPDGTSTVQTTGLVFGAGPSLATDPIVFGATPYNRYNIIGEYGGAGGPTNSMFTSNPKAIGGELGTGMKVSGSNGTTNAAFEVFTTAQALYNGPNGIGSRVYFGNLVLRFNQPVLNPVIHLAGLGGSYRYLPVGLTDIPSNYVSTFFATELELVNTGLTSTLMSGNQFFQITGNNVLNNNDANPNGGSAVVAGETFNNFGAATGSVRLNGTVQEVVYRVYLQGGTSSQFAWSVPGTLIANATRDPFTGDIWYAAVSLDKPTQQISGNVFNDRDGLVDNNINQSVGVANPKTNAGGLFANLLNAAGTTVIATIPVGGDGTFLFDNVAIGSYTVQLSTNQGVPGQPRPGTALPAGWVNTGEFGSTNPGNIAGNDGNVNGISDLANPIVVGSSEIKPEVNFGIERLPESVDFTRVIPSPSAGITMILSPTAAYPLPPLTGSDPEDQPISGPLTGKTVVITNLPNNGTLIYAGNNVISGTPIPNFNANLLTVTFNGPAQASLQFNYAYVDASGRPDPTPALYRLVWTGGPLAITLTNFTAVKNNCIAGLTWKTAEEINASRFEIEVSNSNSAVYAKVGSVNATATNGKTYQFNYPMQAGIQYYFRLKMIDKDGAFKYSDVRSLTCDGKGTIITIAPNPVIDQFVISGMENGKNTIVVLAANGQLVKTQIIPQAQGYVNIVNLASGMYSVKIISEKGKVTVGKIIKN